VSRQTLSRTRGCLTTHLSLPCARGIWPAFWLLPKEPFEWPRDGEIDIAETWNGDCENHSCLHWGFYTPEDRNKHLVRQTRLPDMASGRPIRYDLVWDCPSGGPGGRLMWYIDNRPVMRATMPGGTRPINEWCIIINIAMGGDACGGKVPSEGTWDYVVHGIALNEQPEGGWGRFEMDWKHCVNGVFH
jgi:beta-glucanase (GH16 family)